MCIEPCVIQQLSPSARLHCKHQGLHSSPKTVVWRSSIRWPQWPSNCTLPPNPRVLKMLIEKCSYVPTKIGVCVCVCVCARACHLAAARNIDDVERNIF